jgi:thioredoxin-like negative regulator of GroEL
VADDPGNWQNHLQLAAVYLEVGQRQQAIAELQKAIDINEEFRQQGEYFISEIRAGRNP